MQVYTLLFTNLDLKQRLVVHFGVNQHVNTHYCGLHPFLFYEAIVRTEFSKFLALYKAQLLTFSANFKSVDGKLKFDHFKWR